MSYVAKQDEKVSPFADGVAVDEKFFFPSGWRRNEAKGFMGKPLFLATFRGMVRSMGKLCMMAGNPRCK